MSEVFSFDTFPLQEPVQPEPEIRPYIRAVEDTETMSVGDKVLRDLHEGALWYWDYCDCESNSGKPRLRRAVSPAGETALRAVD